MKGRDVLAARRIWTFPEGIPDTVTAQPGTLAEVFAAEDSRRATLVLYEIRDVDGFRRCAAAVGCAVDPYEIIDAVMGCVTCHVYPLPRLADHAARLRRNAVLAEEVLTAGAPDRFVAALDPLDQIAWRSRCESAGITNPSDPRVISELRSLASGVRRVLMRGAFKDGGGPRKKFAFRQLIRGLAGTYESAAGKAAGVTHSIYSVDGYSGKFWDLVEVVRPIAAGIIEKSGEGMLDQPVSANARGAFIEAVLRERRSEKRRRQAESQVI